MKLFSLILFFFNLVFSFQDLEDLSFGSEESLDIATWNIEWFPKNNQLTIDYVSKILQQLELDILAIQELNNKNMFDQMLDGLDNYVGYYESEWFAGLAYIYNPEVIEINNIYEIYTTSQYWSAFPRSPMIMDMNFMGENYYIINNHFKCCGDGYLDMFDESDEEKRRFNAINLLKDYIDSNLSNKKVIVMGDLNDDIAESNQNNVFINILNDIENYSFVDYEIAISDISNWSFPSWPSHLDHILITNELFYDLNNSNILTIKVDEYLEGGWNEYDYNISDHRPVAISFIIENEIIGDLNGDGIINVLDIIELINIILDGNYNNVADLNNDGLVNILDVIIYKNIILNT